MASDINSVMLVGRLTRDAELRYTSGGTAVSKCAIAVNRNRKQGDQYVDEASFFDIVIWGRRGEALQKYLEKGKQVAVQGELKQNRWEDRQTGQNRSKVEVHIGPNGNIQLLGGGSNSSNEGGHGYGGTYNPQGPGSNYHKPSDSAGPEEFEDDIPF